VAKRIVRDVAETGIIYGRASRDPRGLGTSVDAQIAECRRWADRHGVSVVRVIRDDDRSASRTAKRQREGFDEVLLSVRRRQADLLICWEASRAARDLNAFLRLRDACAESGVGYAYQGRRFDLTTGADRFATSLDALLAEREADAIRERNLRTVRRNAEQGRPHGRLPYGYRRIYDDRTGQLLRQEPDPGQAKVLQDATRELLDGGTLRAVCRRLNAAGIPSPRRPRQKTPEADFVRLWEPSSLRQLLLKPSNAGLRQHQGKVVGKAAWEPVVAEGEWLRLKKLLTDPARRSAEPRGTEPRHLLSGIAVCGECGARVKAATNLSRMPRAYACRHEGCMRVVISADRADEVVLAVLRAYLERDDVRLAIADQAAALDRDQGVASDAEVLLQELRARLEDAFQRWKTGELSAGMLGRIESELQPVIERAEAAAIPRIVDPSVRRLLDADDLILAFDEAALGEQRAIVRALFKVTLNRATVRGRKFDHRRVVVDAATTDRK
jgi:site-specific DNA recombinase